MMSDDETSDENAAACSNASENAATCVTTSDSAAECSDASENVEVFSKSSEKTAAHLNPSENEGLYEGYTCNLNSALRTGTVHSTSRLSPRFKPYRFFFSVPEESADIFEQMENLQKVKFRVGFDTNDKPVLTELKLVTEKKSIDVPIKAPETRTRRQEFRHDDNTNVLHDTRQRRNTHPTRHDIAHQEPKPNQRQRATQPQNKVTPSMGLDTCFNDQGAKRLKNSAMIGEVVVVRYTGTENPHGYIQPEAYIVERGRSGVRFDLRKVKPAGVKLMRGDKVKFVMQTRKERSFASRVFIHSLNSDRSKADIESILTELLSSVLTNKISSLKPNAIPNQDAQADLLINVLGNKEIWKCIGNFKQLSCKGVVLLMDLLKEIKDISKGLTESFTSIVQALSHTNLLNHHSGPLANLIYEAMSNKDDDMLVYIRKFLLLIADHVPEKMAAVSSLVKPMVSKDRSSVEFFLWRALKSAVRSKDTLIEDQGWDELPLVPSPHEMLHGPQEGAYNLEPAKPYGQYANAEEYMDINFRLLRADCFNALNKGIRALLEGNLDHRDMNAYHGLKVHGIKVSDHDSPLTVALNITPLKPVKNWEKARNLMYGNLVCISVSGTFQDPIWATVSSRDLLPKNNIVMLELCSECNQIDDADAITMLQYADSRSVMAESPTYYKSYQPVLQSLQNIDPETIPFKKEIVYGRPTKKPSFYSDTSTLDAGVIYYGRKSMIVEDFCQKGSDAKETSLDESTESREQGSHEEIETIFGKTQESCTTIPGDENTDLWEQNSSEAALADDDISLDESLDSCEPELDDKRTTLDKSQETAVRECLMKRVAIIQGPPGTGKTFIGAKLVQLLNTVSTKPKTPILVLTYKNHALDEFMKEMIKKYPGDIVRIGGRSTALAKYNLSVLKREIRKSCELSDQAREYHEEMEEIKEALSDTSEEIKSKMQPNFNMMLSYATSVQLERLLRKCDWNKLMVPSMFIEYGPSKGKKTRYVDSREVNFMLRDIRQPIKEYISSPDYNLRNNRKAALIDMLDKALHAWLPSVSDFDEVRNSLYTTVAVDFSKLSVCVKKDGIEGSKEEENKEEDEKEEEEEESVEQVRAEENERRLAATGMLKGETVNLEDLINTGSSLQKGKQKFPSIFPIPKEFSSEVFRMYLMQKEDLWDMTKRERVLYIQNMLHIEFNHSQKQFKELLIKYKNLHKCKSELDVMHSVSILREKKVVGMTITGANIHCDLIAQLKPEIVLVEEAAEVMEPQILSTLGEWVKQLILIGDQKQLRPNVESFEMKRFNLDISLMERLINNRLHCSLLELQNRMRPEFAEMLKDIYPSLRSNLERVGNNQKPPSATKAMYFWTHNHPELGTVTEDTKAKPNTKDMPVLGRSYRNEEEADRCIRLAVFFIQQGHPPWHITILAAYLGQVHLLRRKMREAKNIYSNVFKLANTTHHDDDFDPSRITIQTIDNYQGDENEIVIVSLVRSNEKKKTGFLNTLNRRCVAQSRAKCGMYFTGDKNTIEASKHWQPLLEDMEAQGCLGPCLQLQCCNHPEIQITPRDAADIPLKPFCKKACPIEMPCGIHACERICQPLHSHNLCRHTVHFDFPSCGHPGQRKCFVDQSSIKCLLQVDFKFPCNHASTKMCYEDVRDKICEQIVTHKFECGHTKEIQCFAKDTCKTCYEKVEFKFPCGHTGTKTCEEDAAQFTCKEKVQFKFPCGHTGEKMCHKDEKLLTCRKIVHFEFPCGHSGEKECYKDEKLLTCKEKVRFTFPCGHIGEKKCVEDQKNFTCKENVHFYFPCGHPGEKKCFENEATKTCKQQIEFSLTCGHNGTRLCYESEDTFVCKEKCTKTLPECGHICSGICSQPCNPDDCRECRRIARAMEEIQRQEEKRKKEEIRKQVDAEIACMKTQMQPLLIVELKEGGINEIEYIRVRDIVLKYVQPMHNWYPTITKIERVYNSELYLQFLECRRTLNDPSVCQEKFHGTNAAKRIAKHGFELPKPQIGQTTELGIHFTSESSTSAQDIYTKGSDTLLLCDVLLGRAMTTNTIPKNMTRRNLRKKGFDSVYVKSGGSEMNDLFIVYNPDQALPKYIIRYKKSEVHIRPLEQFKMNLKEEQDRYEMHRIRPKREVDYKDPLDVHFRIVESQFLRLQGRLSHLALLELESIEYHINPKLVKAFEAKENEFKAKYGQTVALLYLAFHGTSPENVQSIVKNNFDISKIQRTVHGFGIYFSEFPDISTAYGEGLLLCKVLPGNSFTEKEKRERAIPEGYDSILVKPDEEGRGKMLVIGDPDQILPCYVIHLKKKEAATVTAPQSAPSFSKPSLPNQSSAAFAGRGASQASPPSAAFVGRGASYANRSSLPGNPLRAPQGRNPNRFAALGTHGTGYQAIGNSVPSYLQPGYQVGYNTPARSRGGRGGRGRRRSGKGRYSGP